MAAHPRQHDVAVDESSGSGPRAAGARKGAAPTGSGAQAGGGGAPRRPAQRRLWLAQDRQARTDASAPRGAGEADPAGSARPLAILHALFGRRAMQAALPQAARRRPRAGAGRERTGAPFPSTRRRSARITRSSSTRSMMTARSATPSRCAISTPAATCQRRSWMFVADRYGRWMVATCTMSAATPCNGLAQSFAMRSVPPSEPMSSSTRR